jgi:transcriptional regulator with XRE-family HTH domain
LRVHDNQASLNWQALSAPKLHQLRVPISCFHMQEPENPTSKEAIAYRLELLREALTDLDQKQIAERVGITAAAWNQYTQAQTAPSVESAMRICRIYGVTLDWIYQGTSFAVPAGIMARLDAMAAQWRSKGRRARGKSQPVSEGPRPPAPRRPRS